MYCDMCGGKIGRDKREELEDNCALKQYHRYFLNILCEDCYNRLLEYDKIKSNDAFEGIIFADSRVENLFNYHPKSCTDEIFNMIDNAVKNKRVSVI